MKRSILLGLVFFMLGVLATTLVLANPFQWEWVHSLEEKVLTSLHLNVAETEEAAGGQLWTCGMHPQVLQDQPGTCPICGMKLVPVKGAGVSSNHPFNDPSSPSAEKQIKYWRAPMDPTYISDQPGKSPMGMDLVPVYEDEEEEPLLPGTVLIDPTFVQNIGVQSTEVKRRDIPFTIRTVGTFTYDESQVFWINTKYEGWIEKVWVNYVGQPVEKGQAMFEVYSPQLVTTQKEYLQALEYAQRMTDSQYPEVAARASSLVDSARQRLLYWDIDEGQIEQLEQSRKPRRTLTVISPVSGVVAQKMDQALEGMHVGAGMNLYKIVDLSTIWLEAEVFENQIPWLRVGQRALVEIPYQGGQPYWGTIRYLYPFLNSRTRTMKVSLELPNPGQKLRADMYADVTFDAPSARGVTAVPEEAVIHSGQRNIIVLDQGQGKFQVKEVTLGINGSGLWEVKEGLAEGDRVVVSSQFLIDSESNLREAIQKIVAAQQGRRPVVAPSSSAAAAGHQH